VDHQLSEEDRIRVQMQVDHFVTVLELRYGISANEATDLLRWARSQRERNAKLAHAGAISLIGMIVTALALSVVEGVKHWLRVGE